MAGTGVSRSSMKSMPSTPAFFDSKIQDGVEVGRDNVEFCGEKMVCRERVSYWLLARDGVKVHGLGWISEDDGWGCVFEVSSISGNTGGLYTFKGQAN